MGTTMKRLKIAILAPEFIPTWGGVGIYTVELVKELSRYPSLELHIITPCRGMSESAVLKSLGKPNVFVHHISKASDTFFYNFTFQLAVARRFRKLHAKYGFDLVHSMNLVHMPDIYLNFNKMKIPHVCTVHTTIHGQVSGFLSSNKNFFHMAPSEKMSLLLYPYIHTMEKCYVRKYSHFITVSEKFVPLLKKEFDFTGKKIIAIHNGIDVSRFDLSKITREEALKKFPSLSGKKRLVCFAGRLLTQKGIQDFVAAAASLDCHAVIAGRGDEKLLQRLISAHKLKNYTFLGYVPNADLPYVLRLSDVFVLPSYYENFPISLLEAMAVKTVCVGTDVGAVDEIIDSKTGILLKQGDVPALKKAITRLLDNPAIRKRLAENAYSKVRKEFTTKKMAKRTWEYYQELV